MNLPGRGRRVVRDRALARGRKRHWIARVPARRADREVRNAVVLVRQWRERDRLVGLVQRDRAGGGAVDDVQLAARDRAVGAGGGRDAERCGAGAARGGDVVVGVAEGRIAGRRDRQRRLVGLVQRDRELGRVGGVVVGVAVL